MSRKRIREKTVHSSLFRFVICPSFFGMVRLMYALNRIKYHARRSEKEQRKLTL